MEKPKKIILTGGGTAGHVTPHLALLPSLREAGCEVFYVGSKNGIERGLAEAAGLPYFGISSGKLRRYLSAKNVTDILRVAKGFADAVKLMRKLKPDIVFSKGGFVTVPVAVAAKLCGVKVVIHESDVTPGLANKLAMPFASRVCVNFPETLKYIPDKKGVLTGSPIRPELLSGSKAEGVKLCGFGKNAKPTVLFVGGSSGAAAINSCVAKALPDLLKEFNVIHLCGKGNAPKNAAGTSPEFTPQAAPMKNYAAFEYASGELPHLFALADIIVSRAGANTLFELLALKKPHILIPLTKEASRGDQLLNAASFEKQGLSKVLYEENLNEGSLLEAVRILYSNKGEYINKMNACEQLDGVKNVIKNIL